MISNEIQTLLLEEKGSDFIISSENVANVNCNNNLYHALLVLSQVKYSTIPVLDNQSHIKGLISMPMIINAIMGIDAIRFEEMEKLRVEEVMRKEVPTILNTSDLEDILRKLTNNNFLCVVDENEVFLGIITRKEILGRVNHLVHELHRQYNLTAKDFAGIKK
ncbi:CBS domain-containing protein [Jeotgalibaca sp. MA1X17-3]|uniref:cyclic-di-AMP-binding protein CbpB n=1 Tax=Jeotgalibaca sp. MA1X17-3 TaxID=2908211 RepID=UPI001F3D9E68|nr:cyclic-di-AMP-binding protein CbpB [Jeotgalibaca sp. MA1X17-3]UJF14649.1 CBS domain-containing protein [Jeotgalibaca sp. MA1X17-3]